MQFDWTEDNLDIMRALILFSSINAQPLYRNYRSGSIIQMVFYAHVSLFNFNIAFGISCVVIYNLGLMDCARIRRMTLCHSLQLLRNSNVTVMQASGRDENLCRILLSAFLVLATHSTSQVF